ncbi:MAG TPA: PilZ-like domain-containing protein [Geobacteraceae bacterium]|nr:PilZ-like domain-containing protein [Geobacteraceae bacterium]
MKAVEYGKYFSSGQQARAVIRLNDGNFLDRNAEIISVDGNLVWLELLGEGVLEIAPAKRNGCKVTLNVSSGWGLFRCSGALEEVPDNKKIGIHLAGKVEEQQRREYFRLDVDAPVIYEIPKDQHITSVTARWMENRNKNGSSPAPVMTSHYGGYKVVKWRGGDDLLPVTVNLSGGGLRFKTPDFIEPGKRILLDLFLPLAPSRVISTVAEIVRCSEIQLSWEKGTSYMTAMKFINIDEKDRESIIYFVFSEQRNQLKAEKERKA